MSVCVLSVYLLASEENNVCGKRSCVIVSLCFLVLVSIFP